MGRKIAIVFYVIFAIAVIIVLFRGCSAVSSFFSDGSGYEGGAVTTTDDYGKAEAWDIDKDGKLNQREMEQYSKAVRREVEGIK